MALLLIVAAFVLSMGALYWVLTQPLVCVRRTSPPAIDSSRLEAHVRTLSERLYPRSLDRPDRLEQAASYLRSQLEGAGGRVVDQVFPVKDVRYRNIIARYGPAQGPLLVIGAHYDSFAELTS
jgi:acetylornithine deacetylase/succinyl-diaminopimelate desuccinylase-like protein